MDTVVPGRYNSSDTWSLAHLREHGAAYATAIAYDESLLLDLHTFGLFGPIPMITRYRSFLFLGDDGHLCLGDPVHRTSTGPSAFEGYPGETASSLYYHHTAVRREVAALAQRSLRQTLPRILSGESIPGVGSRSALLPALVGTVRTVLCFVRLREEDPLFMLVPKYSLFSSNAAGVAQVNEALASEVRPDPKPAYGAKVKQQEEMYAKWVPVEYVPDQYANPKGGSSGSLRPSVVNLLASEGDRADAAAAALAEGSAAESAAVSAGTGNAAGQRWNSDRDDQKFLQLYGQLNPAGSSPHPAPRTPLHPPMALQFLLFSAQQAVLFHQSCGSHSRKRCGWAVSRAS